MADGRPTQFEQVIDGAPLYHVVDAAGDHGWCGYLLGKDETVPGATISFKKSFEQCGGHYLFALGPPDLTSKDTVEKFCSALYGKIKPNTRICFWFKDPAKPEKGLSKAFFFSFGFTGQFSILQSNLNNHLTEKKLTFSLQNGLFIGMGEQGLVIKELGPHSVEFVTSPKAHGPSVSPNQTTIPFFGPYRGCFLLEGQLNTHKTVRFFEGGLHFAHGPPPGSKAPNVVQQYPVIDLAEPGVDVSYRGSIDLLDPVNASLTPDQLAKGQLRTCFALAETSLTGWLRTAAGRSVNLIPQGGTDQCGGPTPFSGALVLEDKAPPSRDRYLTFAGDFALEVEGEPQTKAGAGATHDLLCGLFGTEVLSFCAYAKDAPFDVLRFVPRQPAYAPLYPFKAASLTDPAGGAIVSRLTDTFRTSWATIVAGGGAPISYSAQPAGAPLYAAGGSKPAGFSTGTPLLGSAPPVANLPTEPGFAVPLVPYAGLDNTLSGDDVGRFESQILSPTRKSLISTHTKAALQAHKTAMLAAAPPATTTATTPQGLLAEVPTDGHGCYQKVTLAAPADNSTPEFAFCNLTETLTDALQTNQLFLVAVNNKELGDPVGFKEGEPKPDCSAGGPAQFLNSIDIADWTFVADVGDGALPTDYRNVLIMKFCDGPLTERLKNPNQWTAPEDFSQLAETGDIGGGFASLALTGLSAWLQQFVADGIEKAKGNSDEGELYKNFRTIATDPGWNGFIVLNANLPLSALPDQIAGLGAGIVLERFVGHHFGSTVSRIKAAPDGSLSIDGVSSLFGLIDYVDPVYAQNVASGGGKDSPIPIELSNGYGFTVLQLQAQFAQAKLKIFRSRIQLSMESLFDSPINATLFDGQAQARPAVVLDGSSLTQDGRTVYVFEQTKPYVFVPDSAALNAIGISRIQFNTLSVDTNGQVDSRFLIWGSFDFATLERDGAGGKQPFDILSFGSGDDGALGQGLAFSNLQIQMIYNEATPGVVDFAFTPNDLAFDTGASSPRPDSLYNGFALQVAGFIAAPADKTPADFGYLPVTPEGVSIDKLQGPWYAISYKIDMGTPGALVSTAGFSSSFATAWAPAGLKAATRPQVFAGLSLPGAAPAASAFSLQGVVKLSTGPIKLNYAKGAGDQSGQHYYTLKLENIGIKILGLVKLPPNATIQFFLFGDPEGSGSLGWWAAYRQDDAGEGLSKIEQGAGR